jgi:AAA ATPase domain
MSTVDIETKDGAQDNRVLGTQNTGFELSDLLPFASQAAFNSEDRQNDPFCFPNTRVDIIEQITKWAGQSDTATIFWLSGTRGVGKTTIARTIAQDFYNKERLGASFFFRANGDVNNASKFFTTIAVQLAEKQTTLKRYIRDAVEEYSDIANRGLREQWNQLIYRPLSKLFGPPQQPLVLVIDALDMCSGDADVKLIISLMSEAQGLKTIPLKFFITCRPEVLKRYNISASDTQHSKYVCELGTCAPDNDISKFVEADLKRLLGTHAFSTYWPGEANIASLVRNSGGSFLWAATACRFICGSSPKGGDEFAVGRLSKLLESRTSILVEEDRFNSIYMAVLGDLGTRVEGSQEKQSLYENVAPILGGLVALASPLSVVSLSNLLSISKENVEIILRQLDSVIQIPDDSTSPLSFYHSSFREFLLNIPTHFTEHSQIDLGTSHRMLGQDCLRVLNAGLKKDACGLQKPGVLANDVTMDLVDRCIPKELQYACENWAQHLQKGSVQVQTHGEVHDFLRNHLLHWLEALSLMRKTSKAASAMVLLEAMIPVGDSSRAKPNVTLT